MGTAASLLIIAAGAIMVWALVELGRLRRRSTRRRQHDDHRRALIP
jgi:hypothetical protein